MLLLSTCEINHLVTGRDLKKIYINTVLPHMGVGNHAQLIAKDRGHRQLIACQQRLSDLIAFLFHFPYSPPPTSTPSKSQLPLLSHL